MTDRLFVPLATGPFEDFRDHGKIAELRAYGRNFTEKHVFTGRVVELRKGYSIREHDWQLWGEVGRVVIGSVDDVFAEFGGYEAICPRSADETEARETIIRLLGERDRHIGFEVLLNTQSQ